MRRIQLFRPKYDIEECLRGIRECLEVGWTGVGFKTLEFERAWVEYSGLPRAHFLNSCTSGIHLALEVFKSRYIWPEESEIISTPLTFVATNHAILHAGLKPVLVDVDDSLCIDPESILQNITKNTRAVIFVGLGGRSGQLLRVADICRKNNLKLIIDAAHMAGTKIDGMQVGREADATVFSFHAVKNLPSADSGMICFSCETDDKSARSLSWLGIDQDTYSRSKLHGSTYSWIYNVEQVGFKYHGNSIMASICLAQLRHLDDENKRRGVLASCYMESLNPAYVQPIREKSDRTSSWHLFQIRAAPRGSKNRDSLLAFLADNGVMAGVHYRNNCDYPMYARFLKKCPIAATASKEIISLPLNLHMKDDDAYFITNIINKYYEKS